MEPLVDLAFSGALTAREAERRVWSFLVPVGAMVLTAVFAGLCRQATEQELRRMGLHMLDVELRMDKDYWVTLKSTFGRVRFPWFAFRGRDGKVCVSPPTRPVSPMGASWLSPSARAKLEIRRR